MTGSLPPVYREGPTGVRERGRGEGSDRCSERSGVLFCK